MMSAAFQHSQSYMAPEMLGENESTRRYLYDFLVDMWITEVVTKEMLTRSTLIGFW